ncbi:MAG: hypothetical protein RLZZ223_51 [Candidatus Parcubacteria bacterium]|jgi:uncharacterized membrane protein
MSETNNEDKNLQEKVTVSPTERQKNIAAVCYVFFLIGLFTVEKESTFVKFHIKQSLTLLILAILVNVLTVIPILGWIIYPFAMIFILILFVMGILNALAGQEKELPIIGKYAKNLSI